ncbi:MAG TPA: uroporphyrinogen-III synthase [Spongiibacteraceae bacterium]|jgi:uroporphyrinogen-III synthase|nr:uroporphyrinogen-III synthase [Spongiibacteraceae bacterium]HUH39031.1 uroporphyrinogen-III synthase [Spongiibacteraceae bacterium]
MASDEQALRGHRILVTRPAGRADELIAALASKGAEVSHIPLLATAALRPDDSAAWQACKARILELDNYQCVIAASVNAVHYGAEWIDRYWPQWPAGLQWFSIGAATAEALRQHGVDSLEGGLAMDSEALLARPELQQLAGARVLILRGVGGRGHLSAVMQDRGARVDYAECYTRSLPAVDAAMLRKALASCAAVSINSGETLANLCQLAPDAPQLMATAAIVVPSVRVADMARERGFQQVVAATNAGTEATVEAMVRYLDTDARR